MDCGRSTCMAIPYFYSLEAVLWIGIPLCIVAVGLILLLRSVR